MSSAGHYMMPDGGTPYGSRLELEEMVENKPKIEITSSVGGYPSVTLTNTEPESNFVRIAKEVGELVTEKNKAYGSAFEKAEEYLKILYPNGIRPDQYFDALFVLRIFDKTMRIANKKDAFGESPYRDINGYSLLAIEVEERNNGKST